MSPNSPVSECRILIRSFVASTHVIVSSKIEHGIVKCGCIDEATPGMF